MKVFNFNNKKVQYLKESDVSKLFKIFQKPDKLFGITNIEISEKSAKWEFENLDADTEFLLIDKGSELKVFNELILYLKEEIEEDFLSTSNLMGIGLAIYQVTEETSLIIYSDLGGQWNQKILKDVVAQVGGLIIEYAFIDMYNTKKLDTYISQDILELIKPRIFNKFV